jgi:hypothetical protein
LKCRSVHLQAVVEFVKCSPDLLLCVHVNAAGVYLKANKEAVAAHGLPPPEHDPGTRFVERQLTAVPADPGGCLEHAMAVGFLLL